MARVSVIHETISGSEGEWRLCLQWCRYNWDDGKTEDGYRFIWRRPEGSLQPARGQARIPSIRLARELMDRAIAEGWGHLSAEGDLDRRQLREQYVSASQDEDRREVLRDWDGLDAEGWA